MKRLLFVTYFMPPRPGIGSVRAGQIVRYLPEFGWDVTVLTAALPDFHHDGVRIVETPALDVGRSLKKAIGLGNRSAQAALGMTPSQYQEQKTALQRAVETASTAASYATNKFGWYTGGLRTARQLAAKGQFDAVLSTSPPESAHAIAASLSANLPWVADFRDLWDGNSAVKGTLEKTLNRMLEPRFLRRACRLITVSEPLANQLRARYDKPVACIRNAFDPLEWGGIPFARRERCTILYAGQLYDGRRDPAALFEAAGALLRGGALRPEDLEIIIHTPPAPWLNRLVHVCGVESIVSIRPPEDRTKIMALERTSDLLWIILFDGSADAGVLTGKLFEYLGARRPILVTGGPEECAIDSVLRDTKAGVRARTVEQIGAQILEAVRRHPWVPDLPAKPNEPYEVRHLARRFADVLNEATGAAPQSADNDYAVANSSA